MPTTIVNTARGAPGVSLQFVVIAFSLPAAVAAGRWRGSGVRVARARGARASHVLPHGHVPVPRATALHAASSRSIATRVRHDMHLGRPPMPLWLQWLDVRSGAMLRVWA